MKKVIQHDGQHEEVNSVIEMDEDETTTSSDLQSDLQNGNNNQLFLLSSSLPSKNHNMKEILMRGRTDSCSSISSGRSLISWPDSSNSQSQERTSTDQWNRKVPKVLNPKMIKSNAKVCYKCETQIVPRDLKMCLGVCQMPHHVTCLDLDGLCEYCAKGIHPCSECNEPLATQRGIYQKDSSPSLNPRAIQCAEKGCSNFFHLSCILRLKNSKYNSTKKTW